jgi:hypothetical protein
VTDANFAKQAEPGAGKVKEMCPQCLLMQRLSSPCHCTAAQPEKAATLLRHGDLLHRSKFQYFQSEYFQSEYWNPITVYNDSIIRNARGRFPELASVHGLEAWHEGGCSGDPGDCVNVLPLCLDTKRCAVAIGGSLKLVAEQKVEARLICKHIAMHDGGASGIA